MNTKEIKLAKLRQRAEAVIDETTKIQYDYPQDIEVLVEELHVHQLELELQLEDLQQAYQALESAQQRYTQLFDFAPVGYIVMNPDGLVLDANVAAGRMLDIDSEVIQGRLFSEFVARDFQDIYYLSWHRVLSQHQARSCELRLETKNGESFPALLNIDVSDRPTKRVLIVITNISTVKESEDVLGQALRHEELTSLPLSVLSIVSQEIRRPLVTVLSSLELLHKHGSRLTSEKRHQLYQTIRNLVWYLGDTIHDALSIHDFENQTLMKLEAFDLIEFSNQIISDVTAIVPNGQRIVFETIAQDEKAIVIWDPNLFRRILMDLLMNALKHSSEAILCRLEVKDLGIQLVVEDKGAILSTTELKDMFERFYKGKNVEFIEGRGNGLFAAYLAVQAHGGTMRYEARAGEPTRFIVDLPRRLTRPSRFRQ
jgi:two-component system, LuxR family, sensor kinase FixL